MAADRSRRRQSSPGRSKAGRRHPAVPPAVHPAIHVSRRRLPVGCGLRDRSGGRRAALCLAPSPAAQDTAGPIRVAVLPFDNSAIRPMRTSPTASPMPCGANSPGWRASGHRLDQLEPVPAHDRTSRGRAQLGVDYLVGRIRWAKRPDGESGAGGERSGRRRLHDVAGAVRRADRRLQVRPTSPLVLPGRSVLCSPPAAEPCWPNGRPATWRPTTPSFAASANSGKTRMRFAGQ